MKNVFCFRRLFLFEVSVAVQLVFAVHDFVFADCSDTMEILAV